MAALFFATDVGDQASRLAVMAEEPVALVDRLGACTRVDLSDGAPNDWELGVGYLPGMDEVQVDRARLDLRGLAVSVPAEGWSCVPQDKGWRITLAEPARLVSIGFDALPVRPAGSPTRHVLLSPADPPGPPAFMSPPFVLGSAYAHLPVGISERIQGDRAVVTITPTLGTSWVLQWADGDDATDLNTVEVETQIRSVTIERAVADVRLELRPDDPSGEAVLVWNRPGVLDPGAGLQPVDLSPIARQRLTDRLTAANALAPPPSALSLPVRLVAATGGPVGVSGTELSVTYGAWAVAGGVALSLRGDPLPLDLTAPAALRPAAGTVSIAARHLGREVNGPVGPPPVAGGPGVLVAGDRWAARAVRVAATGAGVDAVLVALTVDLGADGPAEVSVELRSDLQGLPGSLLGAAVLRLEAGRLSHEVMLPSPVTVPVGRVVWVSARTTAGTVRWYAEPPTSRGAAPEAPAPTVRVSADRGTTWAPIDERLSGAPLPRARVLHRVDPPFESPVVLAIEHAGRPVGGITLSPVRSSDGEYAVAGGSVPPPLLDLLGRTTGHGKSTTTVVASTSAALDLTITRLDLSYPPTAGPTPS